MALMFGILYYFVIFLSFSSCKNIVSREESQNDILEACENSSCVCTKSHYKHIDSDTTWSELNLTCKTFEQLKAFSITKKAMVYDSTTDDNTEDNTENKKIELINSTDLPIEVQDIIENKDGENYSNDKKKAFEVIEAVVEEPLVPTITSNCSEIMSVCFENEKNDDLKYITRLKIVGKELWRLGTKEGPILQLFPNLRNLTIISNAPILEIQLVELSFLGTLSIHVNNAVVKLYCAFDNELCLSNPKGLDRLYLDFNSTSESAFKVYGNFKFPKKIYFLTIHVDSEDQTANKIHKNIDEEKGAQTGVFKNIEFDYVVLDLPPQPNHFFDIKDFSGITVHTRFTINGESEKVIEFLLSAYETGLQYPLGFSFGDDLSTVPFINLKNETFDESQFTSCKYGKKLLDHAYMNEYQESDDKILIIRGFHLKLTQIMEHARNRTTYSSIKIIRVYAYNFDVDEEPSVQGLKLEEKKLVINYVNVGTTKAEIAGIKNQTYKKVSLLYRYVFQIQFISMKSKHDADPIFMRAAATCLIMNIGSQNKLAPNSLIKSDQRLSTWYDVIRKSANFNNFNKTLYTPLEISRTLAAFNYLEEYIMWRDNQNTNVTRVPFLSLQVLSQNIQILAQAGRDIRDKSNHLQSLASLEEIKKMASNNLKKTLQSVGDAKIAILKASKQKSESLGDIELRKQNDIDKQINNSQKFIDYLTNEFSKFSKEVEDETINFKNGVILATTLAVAEAAAEAVNCVLGIFTGGFNPAKALKTARNAGKLATIIPKLMKVMKTIKNLIQKRQLLGTIFKKVKGAWKTKTKKLTEFFKRQKDVLKDWWNKKPTVLDKKSTKDLAKIKNFYESSTSFFKSTTDMVESTISFIKAERTVRIGFDPGNPLQDVATLIEQFKDKTATEAIEQSKKLSAEDVFKWTIAKEHTVGMIDSTLSNDVPEATNYRTALLKLITTGETKTQATIDQAALETSFSASRHAWGLYFEESVFTAEEIIKTEDELESVVNKETESIRNLASKSLSAAYLDVEWEKLAIKLEFIRLNEEYCNAYYYFHLEKCQEDLVVNPSDDLEKILSIQSKLLYQSNQNLRQLYPPPQTFTDLTITIKEQKYCSCLSHLNTTIIDPKVFEDRLKIFESEENNAIMTTTFEERFNDSFKTLKEERNSTKEEMYNQVKKCLQESGVSYSADHKFVNEILMNCTNDTIQNLKKDRQFSFTVDIDSSYFLGRERVRIDEVKVIFKGAKTLNGIVETYAESTGVSEDRYNDRCFKFIGDKWIRTISYYSKSAVIQNVEEPGKRSDVATPDDRRNKKNAQWRAIKEIKDLIKTQSKEIKSLNKKVQILLKEKQDQVTFIDSGNVHESFQGVFRAPTVFTTWLFVIPENRNPGLDLTGVNEIELKFSGSFITTGLSNSSYQCKAKDQDESNEPNNDALGKDQTLNGDQSEVNQQINDVRNVHQNHSGKQTAFKNKSRNSEKKLKSLKTDRRSKHKRRKSTSKENEFQESNVLNKEQHDHRYHR